MDFITYALLLILTCTIVQAFISFLATTRKSNQNLPPGPPRLPIIGNLFELGSKPHQSLAKLAKTHGPIMSLKFGQVTSVVISSAEMAKEVLQTHDHFLSNRTIPQSISVHNHEHYSLAFMPVSPLWREWRKICNTQLFSHHSLDCSQDIRREKVQQLINDINKSSQIGEVVDIGREAFKITINLLTNTIFSEDLVHSSGIAGEFKDLITNMTKHVGSPNLADYFHILKFIDPQRVQRDQTKNFKEVSNIFNRLISKRLTLLKEKTGSNIHDDMLNALLDISKENKLMEKSMIEHLLLDLFVAGTDTTSSTLEWAMTELILNPEIMSKAKKELEEIIGKGKPIEESDITKLPYLQAIIKETFRLHPPVPLLLPRKAERDVEICGYIIPKDAQVMVNVWTIGRDPTLWDNPNLFSPERFIGSEIDVKGRNFELAPFGAGRRICPAVMLGMRMVSMVLGSLINTFDWMLEEGMKAEDVDMDEKFGITLQKAQPLRLVALSIDN